MCLLVNLTLYNVFFISIHTFSLVVPGEYFVHRGCAPVDGDMVDGCGYDGQSQQFKVIILSNCAYIQYSFDAICFKVIVLVIPI